MPRSKKPNEIKYGIEITKPHSQEMYDHNDMVATEMKTNILNKWNELLKEFQDDTPCFVFTDDLEWCKSHKFFRNDRFLFNEDNQRYTYSTVDGSGSSQNTLLPQVDLCLMSLCSGAIIANSSFSCWGEWLQNDRGKIIAPDPKKWFGSAKTHVDTSDVIPDRWFVKSWEK